MFIPKEHLAFFVGDRFSFAALHGDIAHGIFKDHVPGVDLVIARFIAIEMEDLLFGGFLEMVIASDAIAISILKMEGEIGIDIAFIDIVEADGKGIVSKVGDAIEIEGIEYVVILSSDSGRG